jgi:CheY-like chemotaxis protein
MFQRLNRAEDYSGTGVGLAIVRSAMKRKISGFEVLRQLKQHTKCRSIPVVILTSSNRASDLQNAYQAGANSYLVKPVDFEAFMEMVGTLHSYWCSLNTLPKGAED